MSLLVLGMTYKQYDCSCHCSDTTVRGVVGVGGLCCTACSKWNTFLSISYKEMNETYACCLLKWIQSFSPQFDCCFLMQFIAQIAKEIVLGCGRKGILDMHCNILFWNWFNMRLTGSALQNSALMLSLAKFFCTLCLCFFFFSLSFPVIGSNIKGNIWFYSV